MTEEESIIKLEFNHMGTNLNGQAVYLFVLADTACIRVSELEQGCKYKHNIDLTIFNFDDKKIYNYIKKIELSDAFESILEVKEFIRVYYKEFFDILDKKDTKDKEPKQNKMYI